MAWGARSVLAAVILAGCSAGPAMPDEGAATPLPTGVTPSASPPWPIAPEPPPGPLDAGTADAVDRLVTSFVDGSLDMEALDIVATSADARLGWILSDLLRFAAPGTLREVALGDAFATLAGFDPRADQRFGHDDWLATTNLLIGWDLAAPTGYRDHKAALFLAVEPAWEPFFADTGSAIDWRWISWGGVFIDDRPIGDAQACRRSCIPALDDPALTTAAEGIWYLDGQTIFGIAVNGEAVAFPKHIMEVHEMVNLTVGGRRVGLPYCTLCGSAQAYLTDAVPVGIETPVLRTTGLLSRSNKVMYDLVTRSAFNTFTGQAVSGPLREMGVELERTSVVVTSWGEWKAAHPATRIVAQDGGIGRTYPNEPLAGRDLGGPIFPVGPVDPRLPAQTAVLGVIDEDGDAIAFPVEQVVGELTSGAAVVVGAVEAYLDGGGLRVRTAGGEELPANQSFWFAWSQFHPATVVWAPTGP